jgi:GH24 family phage-related lysozyme (muramidase)
MKTSQNGINLIKQFEGCRLNAYKPVPTEQYWTIGYGHYGPDVAQGMVITQAQAEIMLGVDLKKYESAVEKYVQFPMSQNQNDALVSFAYNCGVGNLKKLVNGRNAAQVAEAMLMYNKAGGKVLNGLTKRRQAERDLFLKGQISSSTVRLNSVGNDVRWVQERLKVKGYDLKADGVFGKITESKVKAFQKANGLKDDGIVGSLTRAALSK